MFCYNSDEWQYFLNQASVACSFELKFGDRNFNAIVSYNMHNLTIILNLCGADIFCIVSDNVAIKFCLGIHEKVEMTSSTLYLMEICHT